MKNKKGFVVIFTFALSLLIFLSDYGLIEAQCTTSSYKCCYGACSSGYRQVSSGGTRCCGTQGGCDSSCNCNWSSCRVVSYVPPCNNCVRCERICSCWCNSCSPPSCPSGTDGTNRGTACYYGRSRSNCGYSCSPSGCGYVSGCYSSYRSCWYYENNPPPTAPAAIHASIGGKFCYLGEDIRVPLDASSGSFLASGARNMRAGDTIGNSPLLRYSYRIPDLGLQSGLLLLFSNYSSLYHCCMPHNYHLCQVPDRQ